MKDANYRIATPEKYPHWFLTISNCLDKEGEVRTFHFTNLLSPPCRLTVHRVTKTARPFATVAQKKKTYVLNMTVKLLGGPRPPLGATV